MSVSGGVISAPVSIKDVQQALGDNSKSLSALCTSDNINKWAKYKPTSYNKLFPSNDEWCKGNDGNYGITIDSSNRVTTFQDVVSQYSLSNNGYSLAYKKPTGGSSSPYRLTDFNGYNHNASPEIAGINISSAVTGKEIKIGIEFNPSSAIDNEVKFGDLEAFKDCYFGVIIYKDNEFKGRLTTSTTISNGIGVFPSIPANALTSGDYIAYPMFCSQSYTWTTGDKSQYAYAVPTLSPISFNVKDASTAARDKFTINHSISDFNNNKTCLVKIVAKEDINSITVYLHHSTDPSSGTSAVAGEYHYDFGSIKKGNSAFHTFNILSDKTYKIYVYIDNVWAYKQMYVITPNS